MFAGKPMDSTFAAGDGEIAAGAPRPRRRALLMSGFDDDVTDFNPIKAVAGRLKLQSFRADCLRFKVFLVEWLGWSEVGASTYSHHNKAALTLVCVTP